MYPYHSMSISWAERWFYDIPYGGYLVEYIPKTELVWQSKDNNPE